MPDIRRCSIYGCLSNSRDRKDLKFFNFPARDSPFYAMWLSLCEESSELIAGQRRPYICSKHFHKKDVGFRRLATGALPALFLTAPPGFAEKENARLAEMAAEQEERVRMINLVNDTVLEWVRRAQHYADTADTCTTRRELRRVAERARNLLGATLALTVDDYWLRKFRRSHMILLMHDTTNTSRNKSLDLEEIISDLEPNATILSEDEIAFLLKEEKARILATEQKRFQARAKKRGLADFSPVVGVHGKKYKGKKKNADVSSFVVYSRPSDVLKDESMSSECLGIKSENNDSIDLSPNEDDDDLEDTEDMDDTKDSFMEESKDSFMDETKDSFMDGDQSVKDEIVINSYQEALQHLKPLEDFALKHENYRAIGLLTTLEIIFKNPKKATDP